MAFGSHLFSFHVIRLLEQAKAKVRQLELPIVRRCFPVAKHENIFWFDIVMPPMTVNGGME